MSVQDGRGTDPRRRILQQLCTQDGPGTGPRRTNGSMGNGLDGGIGAWQAERKS